ncbi:helix-turn-helix domain-containing protein [Psychrobacter sp. I-STPA10]|uniref:helix-turn-helix domain-containing protein n=1 Tax=Psychrobacter sp. I-STPA10 TaxID=2585769 RepID=UPI001E3F08E1|nr:helix-turn-helix transcriptional regulator [Psychrobacter sp. I-STPA10]
MTGFTQVQVAEILEMSNDAVSRMERGKIMSTVAGLMQTCIFFSLDKVLAVIGKVGICLTKQDWR